MVQVVRLRHGRRRQWHGWARSHGPVLLRLNRIELPSLAFAMSSTSSVKHTQMLRKALGLTLLATVILIAIVFLAVIALFFRHIRLPNREKT